MLEELDVQNFALIDHAHVEFSNGFTVLSGETGAGKSILISSLAFLLGGRAGLEQIRPGFHEAQVSGVFLLESKEASLWLEEHGIEPEVFGSTKRILLRRVVKDTGKSSAWIGSVPVTKADLASFASFLVDLHGQHEQQSLLKVSEHRRYLDIYTEIVDEVKAFSELYLKLVEKRKVLASFTADETSRKNRIEMLTFAVNEIQEANLVAGEEEELSDEENKLVSFEKLYGEVDGIIDLFDGSENSSGGIVAMLRRLNTAVSHAATLDKSLSSLQERLLSAFYEIDDISGELHTYSSSLLFDPERLTQVQDRLELIHKLQKKYVENKNPTVQDILSYAQRATEELNMLDATFADKSALEQEISNLEKQVYAQAKAISAKRKLASEKMSLDIEQVLSRLGMQNAKFCVNLVEKPGNDIVQKCGLYGIDDIEFLISANPGSPMQPLSKVASGGELSRVMLALKTILSSGDTVGTLIFDEIDTGIGGEVAVSIGEYLKKLSQNKQVLCITHLASIAVYADNQIKIQKGVEGSSTATNVFSIEGESRIKEIARMLSGDVTSQESLEHASAMLYKFGGK